MNRLVPRRVRPLEVFVDPPIEPVRWLELLKEPRVHVKRRCSPGRTHPFLATEHQEINVLHGYINIDGANRLKRVVQDQCAMIVGDLRDGLDVVPQPTGPLDSVEAHDLGLVVNLFLKV